MKATAAVTITAVRAGEASSHRDRCSVGCAEADGGEEGEDDDEVGQVAQGLRQFQSGEPRRAHEVDRDLAGDRVADGNEPQHADALLAEERQDDDRGEHQPAEHHDGDRGCRPRRGGSPALPVPRAADESGHDPMSDGAAQQVSRHREVAAPAFLVDDDEVENDPGGGQCERSGPEPDTATPDGAECGCVSGDVGEKCGDRERDERNDGGLLEEEQATEKDDKAVTAYR